MALHTTKSEGIYKTVISRFGVDDWDESIYIQAGLRIEGNNSAKFYDYGACPLNTDNYMRHLTFETLESPDIKRLCMSGRALIQFFELEEFAGSVAVEGINADESHMYFDKSTKILGRIK
jgi:hypothetical protein